MDSGKAAEGVLKAEHSNRWNWAIKTVVEENFGEPLQSYGDLLNYSKVISDLALKGPESKFFKHTIELLQSVDKKK